VRLIGTINNEHDGLAFSHFLYQKGIGHRLEVSENKDWGSSDYGASQCKVWIEEEDQVDDATQLFNLYIVNPLNPIFAAPPKIQGQAPLVKESKKEEKEQFPTMKKPARGPITTLWERQPMGPITRFFLFICTIIFIIGALIPASKAGPDGKEVSTFFSSPIEKAMLYDFPWSVPLPHPNECQHAD